ncbi:diguanylate cyclase domain-containing protein [Bacillus dakarensis]|uniref:diguanylate cyclase domain-containing protein n=1 Tax=Robertmurraya dakarensis TaxID=1926278 RepID=UPI0009819C6E|nr:diguanylate cyclase [Bacillus dakarensis]
MQWRKQDYQKLILDKSICEVYTEDEANFLREHYIRVVLSRESVIYEDSFETPLGEKFYSKTKLTPFFDDRGECTHILAIVQDTTEKKRAELEIKEYWNQLSEGRQRYRSLFHHNPDAIFSLDLEGHIVDGNIAVESITGYSIQELIDSKITSLVSQTDIDVTQKHFQKAIKGNFATYRMGILHKTGERVEVMLKFTPILVNKEVVGVYGILKDVTEFEKVTKKYKESEKRERIIAENAQDLIMLLDDKGLIIYASPSHEKVSPLKVEEYIGKFFFHNVHPQDRDQFFYTISHSIKTGEAWKLQMKIKHQTKGWVWFEMHGTPVFNDEDGLFQHMVCISRDIQLQKEYESKLKHLAFHDPLTGLPNRRSISEQLSKALNEIETKGSFAVMLLDIDKFKDINDNLGHDIGDMVIVEFGKRLKNQIRDIDSVARLGGDEFIILLRNIDSEDEVIPLVEGIQNAIHEPWNINGLKLNVTSSLGAVINPRIGTTEKKLFKHADLALYEAKEDGRDTYSIKPLND